MLIHLRLFAAIREILGREQIDLTLADGATPEDAWRELTRLDERGTLASRRQNLAAAVNRKYTKFDTPLAEGDELVFIPPVSGGRQIAETRRGMVLVTGPTGSGKSTTLAAIIDHINENREAHIITIEDPLEFVHPNKRCLISQREVKSHTKSFSSALKMAAREDPDIVLVGEMRDLETIRLALAAAELGILVFGTLHTNSASKTIDRIIDAFPADEQPQVRVMLADSLKAVVAQQLLKTADGKGRCAANEILVATSALSNLIREGKISMINSMIQTGASLGMQTMDMALGKFVKEGRITAEAAFEKAIDKENFKKQMGPQPAPAPGGAAH